MDQIFHNNLFRAASDYGWDLNEKLEALLQGLGLPVNHRYVHGSYANPSTYEVAVKRGHWFDEGSATQILVYVTLTPGINGNAEISLKLQTMGQTDDELTATCRPNLEAIYATLTKLVKKATKNLATKRKASIPGSIRRIAKKL